MGSLLLSRHRMKCYSSSVFAKAFAGDTSGKTDKFPLAALGFGFRLQNQYRQIAS